MSLNRLIYYSAIIGGWAALVGCLISELIVRPGVFGDGYLKVATVAALVGAAVGGGLNWVAGMSNAQWRQQVKRTAPGLLLGGAGGALGAVIGNAVFTFGLPRAIGWCVMGLAIGAVDGLFERAWKKIRNGLIGGALGGLLGGLLFDPVRDWAGGSGLAGRAIAFVLLGVCIGALVGLVQVVLKTAWLTVLDGYRPGRQLILSREATTLGRAENAALPFFGLIAREVEKQHATIVRQPNGQFVLHDQQTKAGTKVNGEPIAGPRVLRDGDTIRLGSNIVRFNERQRSAVPAPATVAALRPAPAPVPVSPPAPAPPLASPAVPLAPPVPGGAGAAPSPPPAKPRAADECPKCGKKVPGPPGRRKCIEHGLF